MSFLPSGYCLVIDTFNKNPYKQLWKPNKSIEIKEVLTLHHLCCCATIRKNKNNKKTSKIFRLNDFRSHIYNMVSANGKIMHTI